MGSTPQPQFDFGSSLSPPVPLADADVRERVIQTLDRPLVVEAGAGTGKTTLLVSRLLHALEVEAVRMQQIVAISFTEKAAAELRLRLRRALEQRCAVDADPSDALQRALQELHQAQISTIHAFAASILRERPVEARLDPQFRTLDELESLQLQRSFWKRWVDEELEGAEAERLLLPALQVGVRLSPDLETLGRALYDNRDLQSLLSYPNVPGEIEEWMLQFRDRMLQCVQHGEDNCREAEDKGLLHLRDLKRRLERLEDLQTSSWPAIFLGELKVMPSRGKREFWRGDSCSDNKDMRKNLQESLTKIQQHLANRVLRGSLQWLERWLVAYDLEKRRMGVVDFQDLLVQAQQLVRNDLAVRVELGRSIGMLCIDEFQDTDPLQAQLALFLAEEGRPAPEWDAVTVGAKLFLVGDPKQSIYRFRRADLDIYQKCCERVCASGGAVVDIVQNFRSRPAILHWTNGVFDSLFDDNDASASEPRHVPLVPMPESTGNVPAVWIVRADQRPLAATASASDALRREEAAAIVGMIQKARHERWSVRTPQGTRPVEARDMAILFGRTSGIEIYEDALRQAGIPFRQEGGKLFFQRQEVRDILHALAACDDPHDEWSIVAALRSPLFGTSDEDLWRHHARFRGFRYSESSDGSPLAEALSVLRSLHERRHALGIAGCVETLLSQTAARAVYAVQPQGSRALTNFEMLARQARAFESSGDQGLREFVRSLRELEDETPRLSEWAPEEESGDHVRLITVHMAKGLEFPFVVLANLNAAGSLQSAPLLFDRSQNRAEARLSAADLPAPLKTAGFREVAERERTRETAEEKRLLYVAATRARDYLIVADFAGDKVSGYLKPLRSVVGALGDGPFGQLPSPITASAEQALPDNVAEGWSVIGANHLTTTAVPLAGRQPQGQPHRWIAERRLWSLEHAQRLENASRSGGRLSPSVVLRNRGGDRQLEAAQADESRLGIVTHAVFEEWTPEMPDAVLEPMAFEICDRLHSTDLHRRVLELVRNAEAVGELRRWLDASTRVRRAVPMQARLAERLVHCVHDLLIETDAGVVCIDMSICQRSAVEDQSAHQAQALRGGLVVQTGQKLACVGTIYLADSAWSELSAPQEQATAFLQRLRDLPENQPWT